MVRTWYIALALVALSLSGAAQIRIEPTFIGYPRPAAWGFEYGDLDDELHYILTTRTAEDGLSLGLYADVLDSSGELEYSLEFERPADAVYFDAHATLHDDTWTVFYTANDSFTIWNAVTLSKAGQALDVQQFRGVPRAGYGVNRIYPLGRGKQLAVYGGLWDKPLRVYLLSETDAPELLYEQPGIGDYRAHVFFGEHEADALHVYLGDSLLRYSRVDDAIEVVGFDEFPDGATVAPMRRGGKALDTILVSNPARSRHAFYGFSQGRAELLRASEAYTFELVDVLRRPGGETLLRDRYEDLYRVDSLDLSGLRRPTWENKYASGGFERRNPLFIDGDPSHLPGFNIDEELLYLRHGDGDTLATFAPEFPKKTILESNSHPDEDYYDLVPLREQILLQRLPEGPSWSHERQRSTFAYLLEPGELTVVDSIDQSPNVVYRESQFRDREYAVGPRLMTGPALAIGESPTIWEVGKDLYENPTVHRIYDNVGEPIATMARPPGRYEEIALSPGHTIIATRVFGGGPEVISYDEEAQEEWTWVYPRVEGTSPSSLSPSVLAASPSGGQVVFGRAAFGHPDGDRYDLFVLDSAGRLVSRTYEDFRAAGTTSAHAEVHFVDEHTIDFVLSSQTDYRNGEPSPNTIALHRFDVRSSAWQRFGLAAGSNLEIPGQSTGAGDVGTGPRFVYVNRDSFLVYVRNFGDDDAAPEAYVASVALRGDALHTAVQYVLDARFVRFRRLCHFRGLPTVFGVVDRSVGNYGQAYLSLIGGASPTSQPVAVEGHVRVSAYAAGSPLRFTCATCPPSGALAVVDAAGRTVAADVGYATAPNGQATAAEVVDLAKGVYFLQVGHRSAPFVVSD